MKKHQHTVYQVSCDFDTGRGVALFRMEGKMKIRLVSHASVLVQCTDLCIWTDPWLFGKAFNDSWSLFPPAEFNDSLLKGIDYIFVSHEHPDHFHIPTLRSLPADFKERVTILYQDNNSEKMFDAFHKLGFKRVVPLPHREIVSLSKATRVYCYHVAHRDSCLAVLNQHQTVLDVNDAEINSKDCRLIRGDIGPTDVVLNQFSIAGYSGWKEYEKILPAESRRILEYMLANHRDLGAKATIPFASFIYFSSVDNAYVNRFMNTPRDVHRYFAQAGEIAAILFPGDIFELPGKAYDSSGALARYDNLYAGVDRLPYDEVATVPLADIAKAFAQRIEHLQARYPKTLLRVLRPVSVSIPDLNTKVVFSIPAGSFQETNHMEECDLVMNSQPLHFGFAHPYGMQTLGASARYIQQRHLRNWKLHRVLLALDNAELHLLPRFLFTWKNLKYFKKRLPGVWNQFSYIVRRHSEI